MTKIDNGSIKSVALAKKMDVRKYFAIALCKKNNWTYKNNS